MTLPALEPAPHGAEARLLELLEKERPLAYAVIAPDLCVAQASGRFSAFLSAPQEVVQGQLLSDLLWEFVGAEAILQELLRGERDTFYLRRINREDAHGELQYLDFWVVPLRRQNPGSGLMLIIEDVTQVCLLEQQLLQERNELSLAQAQLARANAELNRLNRLKSLFMAIAAHDLRAPLSAIRAYAEMILLELPPEADDEHREFLINICDQVERLDLLIADFLDLDLLEQGKLSVQLIPCDLNEIACEVGERMRRPAYNQGLALGLRLSEGPNQVMADPDRLRQVLYNLIGNAIKFTPQGGRVEITTASDGPQWGLVQVQDTGIGIAAEETEHLFELYFRSEEARYRHRRGVGLGLYIVKTLVEAQNGQIAAHSAPGRGALFTVRLPELSRRA